MKLSYRGASYDYNQPTLEITEGEILGKYRGATWRCHTLQEVPTPQPTANLTYRGTRYTTGSGSEAGISYQKQVKKTEAAVKIPSTLSAAKEIARIHQANLQRNLERRLQAARLRGDQTLVQLLEAEFNQLV